MAGYVMRIEAHKLHWIWKETDTRLDVLAGRVREGVEVLAASDFARWLQFSGLLEVFDQNLSDGVCKVDGKGIRKKVGDLLFECGEWFRLHENSYLPRDMEIPRSEMEKVNRRLNQIEEHLAKLVPSGDRSFPVEVRELRDTEPPDGLSASLCHDGASSSAALRL